MPILRKWHRYTKGQKKCVGKTILEIELRQTDIIIGQVGRILCTKAFYHVIEFHTYL